MLMVGDRSNDLTVRCKTLSATGQRARSTLRQQMKPPFLGGTSDIVGLWNLECRARDLSRVLPDSPMSFGVLKLGLIIDDCA
jgi:hypothetical protein